MESKYEEKFRQIKEDYWDSDVCLGEMLASVPADGLSMEEAFELYMEAMNWCEGDRFFRIIGTGEELEELC